MATLKDSNFRRYQIIRWMVYISLFLGHSSYYFSWKSYTFAIPALIRDLNLKKNELGVVTSGFAAMYQGVEKFSGGFIIRYSESQNDVYDGNVIKWDDRRSYRIHWERLTFDVFWSMNGLAQGCGSGRLIQNYSESGSLLMRWVIT